MTMVFLCEIERRRRYGSDCVTIHPSAQDSFKEITGFTRKLVQRIPYLFAFGGTR